MAETPTSPLEATLAYAEDFHPEDEILRTARLRGAEVGAPPIAPSGGAALCFLATAINARAVVEIGTGCGVSGLWLLRGMRQDGTLTSVDVEPEHQRLARQSFAQAGFSGGRVRLITGRALDVLPRLSDGGYDMVFCDGAKQEYGDYLAEAVRLLRVGGIVVFDNALWHHRVADPTQRDPDTVAVRELGKLVRADERLRPLLLPLGDGILAALKLTD
ncbi:O-methyltransferase [Planobispora siamensis]|uniref:O-methyltransferase n=1 Tax=Planobispora siamensis TaxID=936338 RepID=A0A8J3SEI9_9ACTN|nr:O-methyltransferase [Planobispora siamensis]GIH91422.1 O-methyltransferase [Planobispora siamensis]